MHTRHQLTERLFLTLAACLILGLPAATAASIEVPTSANWYFYLDLQQMRESDAGLPLYRWLQDEVFEDVREDTGVDIDRELERLTSYSVGDKGGVLILDGNFSQATRDKVMAFIASDGDIALQKSDGKTYYHVAGDPDADDVQYRSGNIAFNVEAPGGESWISMDLDNRLVVTSTEQQMQSMLSGRRAAGSPTATQQCVDGAYG